MKLCPYEPVNSYFLNPQKASLFPPPPPKKNGPTENSLSYKHEMFYLILFISMDLVN